jgi:hypothetical protein
MNDRTPNPAFCINGTVYHKYGSLRPQIPYRQNFSQLYFCDAEDQLITRTSLISHLNPRTIELLQGIVLQHNRFAQEFKTVYEQYGATPFGSLNVVIKDAQAKGRRYDQQTYPEIAAMVVENSVDGSVDPHAIVMRDQMNGLRVISALHASYTPLHYVLMFPFGGEGWFLDMRSNTQDAKQVTIRAYHAYMMMVRDDSFSNIWLTTMLELKVDDSNFNRTIKSNSVLNCIVVLVTTLTLGKLARQSFYRQHSLDLQDT